MEAMAIVHMSEAEVALDLHAVLAKVQQGVEIVIEQDHRPVGVLKPSKPAGRMLSEVVADLKARGADAVMDEDFARDVEAGSRPSASHGLHHFCHSVPGVVLDSSLLIAAERSKPTAAGEVENLQKTIGDTPVELSAVTVAELGHGIYRANTPEIRKRRRKFLDELKATLPVYLITEANRLQ